VAWPENAPLAHGAAVQEVSTKRTGYVVGYSRADDGSWHWAVHMDDDDRVWMVNDDDRVWMVNDADIEARPNP
jgi:hypothetical protein